MKKAFIFSQVVHCIWRTEAAAVIANLEICGSLSSAGETAGGRHTDIIPAQATARSKPAAFYDTGTGLGIKLGLSGASSRIQDFESSPCFNTRARFSSINA
jgi:hypothetical protein